ncbi:MAG: hypothetical protein J6C00_13085 [Eubacterium sp.]|nr:hypothetical protein [Eubacterium sp.]
MQILIDGKDISDSVTVSSCIHEDSASGRSDALSVSFNDDTDSETNWRGWNLVKDTEIEVNTDQFRSGTMYVSRISVSDGRFDVRAQAVRNQARDESTQSYEDVSFVELLQEGAKALNLTLETYGLTDYTYESVIRLKQNWLGFLNQRCLLEGAGIKIYDKKLVVFDEKSFENMPSVKTITAEDFACQPEFVTVDDVIREVHNRFRAASLIDTTVQSGISYGKRIETEIACTSIGESIRFSNNLMRATNKNEYRVSGVVTGCELSSGVTVELDGSVFGVFAGLNFIDRVVTDMVHQSQRIYMRKPIAGDY